MFNPRSLVYTLYQHWDSVEALTRLSRDFAGFSLDQVLACIARASPSLDAEAQAAVVRSLLNADILQKLARSDDVQLNAYVLEFVRGLSREHELGLAAVLQARVLAIREARESLNLGMQGADMDRVRAAVNQLAELFRHISLQLEQDRHAIFELAEQAKSADGNTPLGQRYQQVLAAYDHYVEPMNAMMDSSAEGSFYRHLEEAEQALDHAFDTLVMQGALYTQRVQLQRVAHQAKDLRRLGRVVAQQCADTLLPLREALRQHNALSSAISHLLGTVRKRGLRRSLGNAPLPLGRHERGFKLHVGDGVRGVMAAARDYQPHTHAFPQELAAAHVPALEYVNEAAILAHLQQNLPQPDLLQWLFAHYSHLQDATLLRLFHDMQHATSLQIEACEHTRQSSLHTIRITYYPHRVKAAA